MPRMALFPQHALQAGVRKREVFGWAMYDFANSGYTTVVLTAVVSNNAAALLMVPIGGAAATSAGLDPRGFFIAIAVAASVDFLTPIGYQTNTMVWGPGGYRFSDYARFGLPITITCLITLLVIVPRVWPF